LNLIYCLFYNIKKYLLNIIFKRYFEDINYLSNLSIVDLNAVKGRAHDRISYSPVTLFIRTLAGVQEIPKVATQVFCWSVIFVSNFQSLIHFSKFALLIHNLTASAVK
jgi:hypothetical protein